MLKKRLRSLVPSATDKQIRSMASLPVSGWGRLSAEFLDGEQIVAAVTSTGEAMTILQALYNTNNNLMQLLSSSFQYTAAVNAYNAQFAQDKTVTYNMVADLYTSPAVKRPIWQAYCIVKEIEKIMGQPPAKIFIEMARGGSENEKGKRKLSRKASLLQLYESILKEKGEWITAAKFEKGRDWKGELEERDDARYRSDKLYLYYTQLGRCMYTGEAIDLGDLLSNDKRYDIDHIWPQARLKDDSLENRVLVTRKANEDKGDRYPVDEQIRNKQYFFWKALYEKGLIGKKKWERLTRNTKFGDDELAGFISRQIVETRQSTKELAKILQQAYVQAELVYVKAGNVSDFRQLYGIVKLRELNDLHHAKDAYLNIVVGNVYHVRFTSDPLRFIKDEQNKANYEYSMKPRTIFGRDVKRGGSVAWKSGEDGTVATVMKQVAKNNVMVTYQCIERNSGKNGGFHNQIPVKGKDGLIPLKTNDPRFLDTQRYGGYSGDAGAYAFLVEHGNEKKRVRSIEFMSVSKKAMYEAVEQGLEQYCQKELSLEEPRILLPKILFNSVIWYKGFPLNITGKSGAQIVGKIVPQLMVSPETQKLLKAACKIAERVKEQKNNQISLCKEHDGINEQEALDVYDTLLAKAQIPIFTNRPTSQISVLQQGKQAFTQLPLAQQCVALAEILKLFTGNGQTDLTLIGGNSTGGKIRVSKNIDRSMECKLVTTSHTGFYTSVIDLNCL